jgi:hypothetical protein
MALETEVFSCFLLSKIHWQELQSRKSKADASQVRHDGFDAFIYFAAAEHASHTSFRRRRNPLLTLDSLFSEP